MRVNSIWIEDIISRELPLDCKNKFAVFLVYVFDTARD